MVGVEVEDLLDHAVLDVQRRRLLPFRQDYALAAYYEH
jgi:hypothetical protein